VRNGLSDQSCPITECPRARRESYVRPPDESIERKAADAAAEVLQPHHSPGRPKIDHGH
jgi:hypothetical protein